MLSIYGCIMIIFNRIRFCILGLLLGAALSAVEVGEKIWEFETGAGENEASVSIGFDGTVYFGSGYPDLKLYALNGETGEKLWNYQMENYHASTPITTPVIGADGLLYVGSNNKLHAIETSTGSLRWTFQAYGSINQLPAIGADGTVYVTDGQSWGTEQSKIYAINGKTGSEVWAMENAYGTPAVGSDGVVYVPYLDGTHLAALDGVTGRKLWEFETGDDLRSPPAIGSDGTVYFGSDDHKLYALDGQSGNKLWEFETGDNVGSPSIGIDGTVYVGSHDKKLYALDGKSGAKKWEFTSSGKISQTPAIASDGTLFLPSDGNVLHALDSLTGQQNWVIEMETDVSSPAISPHGIVYLTAENVSKVYAFQGPSSPADSPWPMFGQNAQRTNNYNGSQFGNKEDSGGGNASETAAITLPRWSWLETYPWIYNDGTWYYMKPIGSQNYLYNYTTQEWNLMGE